MAPVRPAVMNTMPSGEHAYEKVDMEMSATPAAEGYVDAAAVKDMGEAEIAGPSATADISTEKTTVPTTGYDNTEKPNVKLEDNEMWPLGTLRLNHRESLNDKLHEALAEAIGDHRFRTFNLIFPIPDETDIFDVLLAESQDPKPGSIAVFGVEYQGHTRHGLVRVLRSVTGQKRTNTTAAKSGDSSNTKGRDDHAGKPQIQKVARSDAVKRIDGNATLKMRELEVRAGSVETSGTKSEASADTTGGAGTAGVKMKDSPMAEGRGEMPSTKIGSSTMTTGTASSATAKNEEPAKTTGAASSAAVKNEEPAKATGAASSAAVKNDEPAKATGSTSSAAVKNDEPAKATGAASSAAVKNDEPAKATGAASIAAAKIEEPAKATGAASSSAVNKGSSKTKSKSTETKAAKSYSSRENKFSRAWREGLRAWDVEQKKALKEGREPDTVKYPGPSAVSYLGVLAVAPTHTITGNTENTRRWNEFRLTPAGRVMEELADMVRVEKRDEDGNIEHVRLHVPEPKQHKLALVMKDLQEVEDDEKPKPKGRAKKRASPGDDDTDPEEQETAKRAKVKNGKAKAVQAGKGKGKQSVVDDTTMPTGKIEPESGEED